MVLHTDLHHNGYNKFDFKTPTSDSFEVAYNSNAHFAILFFFLIFARNSKIRLTPHIK